MTTMQQLSHLTTKHLGNTILSADRNQINGYKILIYKNYSPNTLELVGTIENDGEMTWDEAYDKIFGKPQVPDFAKSVTV